MSKSVTTGSFLLTRTTAFGLFAIRIGRNLIKRKVSIYTLLISPSTFLSKSKSRLLKKRFLTSLESIIISLLETIKSLLRILSIIALGSALSFRILPKLTLFFLAFTRFFFFESSFISLYLLIYIVRSIISESDSCPILIALLP